MLPNRHRDFQHNRQKGAILPIVAIMTGTLLVAFVLLRYNTVIMRTAASDLRRQAWDICHSLAQEQSLLVFQRQVAEAFQARVVSLQPLEPKSWARLTGARLIIPTMPDACPGGTAVAFSNYTPMCGGSFSSAGTATPCTGAGTGAVCDVSTFLDLDGDGDADATEGSNVTGVSFASAGLPNCTGALFGGADCILQTNVFWPDADDRPYPETLWNNVEDPGVTVGCELTAEVARPLSLGRPPVTLKVRVAAWRPVIGDYPDYASYPHAVSNQEARGPGLTIAIAPHLTTFAHRYEFRFPPPGIHSFSTIANPGRSEAYDPRYQYSNLLVTQTDSWGGAWFGRQPAADTNLTRIDEPPQVYVVYPARINPVARSIQPAIATDPPNSVNRNFNPPGNSCAANDTCNGAPFCAGANCIIASDAEEMLTACANPLVTARNALLATLVELASRHGQLRAATEVLLVGTQKHNPAQIPVDPATINPPTTIVPFGSDLLNTSYQIPYVAYNPNLTGPGGGPINHVDPFLNIANSATPEKQFLALLAGQLRYCFHMYRGATTSLPTGQANLIGDLARYDLNLGGFGRFRNNGFEDPSLYFEPSGALPLAARPLVNWDQNCPFNSVACSSTGSGAEPLTASELVSALGSIQKCPYPADEPADNTNLCTKGDPSSTGAAVGTPDLRPDVIALVSYLYGQTPDLSTAPCSGGAPGAFQSPGITAVGGSYARTAQTSSCIDGEQRRSPVIIVLHQRLTSTGIAGGQSEVARIQNILSDSDNPPRQIFVIYMPDNGASASTTAVENIRTAFNIPANPTVYDNRLFVFSPYSGAYPGEYTSANDQDNFRDYWLDLLFPGDPDGPTGTRTRKWIVDAAFNIFSYLLRHEKRL